MAHIFDKVCIIGIGLIGGSLARAARAADLVGEIVGCGRNEANLERAVELGVIDRFDTDPAAAVADAELVVLGVPLGAMQPTMEAIRPALRSDAILTDVGSAKASVVDAARSAFGEVPPGFVPGHPIAGTEKSGVDASFSELFRQRRIILTPTEQTDSRALGRVRSLWQGVGGEVVEMSVEHHDEVLAATSHLPHVLAFTLVDTLSRLGERDEVFQYAAGGFRDFTRIASSDPIMWRDICLANRSAILDMIERYQAELSNMQEAIQQRDGQRLLEAFLRAKQARDRYCGG